MDAPGAILPSTYDAAITTTTATTTTATTTTAVGMDVALSVSLFTDPRRRQVDDAVAASHPWHCLVQLRLCTTSRFLCSDRLTIHYEENA